MEMISVKSSNIEAIGFDEGSETLQVEFKGGSLYQYFDVSEQVFNDFVQAGSKGRFLAQNIKGVYRYTRV